MAIGSAGVAIDGDDTWSDTAPRLKLLACTDFARFGGNRRHRRRPSSRRCGLFGSREFWRDFHRGGMAEWSMAVVKGAF